MHLLLTFFIFWSAQTQAQSFSVPPLRQHVNDYAKVIPNGVERQLNASLRAVKNQTGIELAVLTMDQLEGETIESASIKVVDQWKLGTKDGDKGLLLFLAIQDRKIRIEVGQGLEGDLTDADSKRIIDQTLTPLLRSGDYGNAVFLGSYQMLQKAAPTANMKKFFDGVRPVQRRSRRSQKGSIWVLLFWIIVLGFGGRSGLLPLILLGGLGGRGGHHRGGGFGGGGFGGGLGGGGGFSGGGASGGW